MRMARGADDGGRTQMSSRCALSTTWTPTLTNQSGSCSNPNATLPRRAPHPTPSSPFPRPWASRYGWPTILLYGSGGVTDRVAMDGGAAEGFEIDNTSIFDVNSGAEELASFVHMHLMLSPDMLVQRRRTRD